MKSALMGSHKNADDAVRSLSEMMLLLYKARDTAEPEAAEEVLPQFQVGERVRALWRKTQRGWYAADIQAINDDGTYRVKYYDDIIEDNKPECDIEEYHDSLPSDSK